MLEYWNLKQIDCIIEPTESYGGLYLGNLDGAKNHDLLKKMQIRAVLTVAKGTGLRYPEEVVNFHEVIPADDVETFDLSRYFDHSIDFIERHRKYTSIFVHCFYGVSRSASVVIAYLMKKNKWQLERALLEVKEKRVINPNSGFMRQLHNYEKVL